MFMVPPPPVARGSPPPNPRKILYPPLPPATGHALGTSTPRKYQKTQHNYGEYTRMHVFEISWYIF